MKPTNPKEEKLILTPPRNLWCLWCHPRASQNASSFSTALSGRCPSWPAGLGTGSGRGDVRPHAATKTKSSKLVAVCHLPTLTSRAAERRKSTIREYILQHIPILTPFSFLFTLLEITCPSAPCTATLSAEFFLFPHVQYDLSLDCDSVLQAIFKKLLVSVCANLYL